MNKDLITYSTYAYTSKNAETSQALKYGDLEIRLRNGKYYFVSKTGAIIENIHQINFLTSKLRGITDDITQIPEAQRPYYALSALAKTIMVGDFELTEEYLKYIEDTVKEFEQWYAKVGKDIQDLNFCELSHFRDKVLKIWKWYLNNKDLTDEEMTRIKEYIDSIEGILDDLENKHNIKMEDFNERISILENIYKEFYPDEMDELTDKVTEIWKWYDINKSLTHEQVQELKRIFSELSLKLIEVENKLSTQLEETKTELSDRFQEMGNDINDRISEHVTDYERLQNEVTLAQGEITKIKSGQIGNYKLNDTGKGPTENTIPVIKDNAIEIGQFLDFHLADSPSNKDGRIQLWDDKSMYVIDANNQQTIPLLAKNLKADNETRLAAIEANFKNDIFDIIYPIGCIVHGAMPNIGTWDTIQLYGEAEHHCTGVFKMRIIKTPIEFRICLYIYNKSNYEYQLEILLNKNCTNVTNDLFDFQIFRTDDTTSYGNLNEQPRLTKIGEESYYGYNKVRYNIDQYYQSKTKIPITISFRVPRSVLDIYDLRSPSDNNWISFSCEDSALLCGVTEIYKEQSYRRTG